MLHRLLLRSFRCFECALFIGNKKGIWLVPKPVPKEVPIIATGSLTEQILLLLFWHSPLGVHSTVRRHQPPQTTVLSQVDCFVQCEVVGSQFVLDGVQPRDTRMPWWSLTVIWWGAIRIIFASGSSSIQKR